MATLFSVLSEVEVLAQCVVMFLSGQDSTSSVIAHTVYLLALHPDKQMKLREEVDRCFSSHGENISPEVVLKLNYLHAVVSEALRLFPPATRIDRSTTEDYALGDTGITLPKGCTITVPIYAVHRDPLNFIDPDSFMPERFSEDNAASVLPYTYLPFGAGPKGCLGMNLALLAVKLCLLYSLRAVEFVRTSKTKVPLKFYNGFGLLHSAPFSVGIKKRSTTPMSNNGHTTN
ncbi:cytochrome P450 3A19-like [Ixodes scapularis]